MMQQLRLLLVTALLLCSAIPNGARTLRTFAPAPAQTKALVAVAPTTTARDEREKAVPEFQLGAFLLDSANAVVPLAGGDGSHVILATKLAQQQLQAETNYWMRQQHTRRKLQETPSAENISELLEDIPQSFADLPGEVAENVAGFIQHLGTQAINGTYYMEQFDELKHKLQDPIALQAGAQLFANNLCLFSTNLGALEASATGISVAPSLLSLSAAGVNVAPQGISISPALLSVGATGVNVAPQGLNIAPALIAVTPGRVAVNPQGGTISPVGLSVTAPADESAKVSKLSQGRRSLRQSLFEDLAHTVDAVAAEAHAAAAEFLGATAAPDMSLLAAPPAAGPARSAQTQAAAGTSAANFTLPVALKGLHNWAAVIGTMCKAANEDSAACLDEYFTRTSSMLDSLAEKYSSLKGANILAALGHDFPKLEIKRPTFFSGSNNVASSNVGAVQLSATGVSVSPCAIPIGPVGASISATGINVGPTLISISVTGVNVQPQGLNVSPNLIVVGPYDTTVAGQGLNIAPALITVSPTKEVVNPVGPLKVADAKVTETLPALPGPGNNA